MRHHGPGAHDADLVGHRHDLAQLVGDQDDGAALRLEVAQDAEQMVGLLRRQHAGGLVQDQDVRAAEQGLEDLDPLLHAHGQARHRRVEVDLEPVVALQRRDLGPGPLGALGQGEAALGPSSRFSSTVNGSTSMKCWWTMPMPGPDRVLRALDRAAPRRRPGSCRCRPGRSRRGCSSGSTCRRRSRRRCRGSCPAGMTRSMWRLAWTAPKRLSIPRSSTAGGSAPGSGVTLSAGPPPARRAHCS